MRTKAVEYKWFIGVASQDELKKKYRQLALQYHPDRNGGKDSDFKEINAEYQWCIEQGGSLVYPIKGVSTTKQKTGDYGNFSGYDFTSDIFEQMNNMFRERERREQEQKRAEYYRQEQRRREEEERRRGYSNRRQSADDFWTSKEPFRHSTNNPFNRDHGEFKKAQEDRVKYHFDQLRQKDRKFNQIDEIIALQQDKGYKKIWCLWEMSKMENLTEDHFKYLQWKLGFNEGWGSSMYRNYMNSQVGGW